MNPIIPFSWREGGSWGDGGGGGMRVIGERWKEGGGIYLKGGKEGYDKRGETGHGERDG